MKMVIEVYSKILFPFPGILVKHSKLSRLGSRIFESIIELYLYELVEKRIIWNSYNRN